MFKMIRFATALGVAVLSPSQVFAVDDARASIHITANIPNKQFHVQPRDPDFGKHEVIPYDPVTQWLGSVRQTYDVKNTDGSIHAYIQEGRALLNGPRSSIVLEVNFNNVRLNGLPQEVVDDATSTPGTQVEMVIRPNSMPAVPVPGFYSGDFTVIFDAVPRMTL